MTLSKALFIFFITLSHAYAENAKVEQKRPNILFISVDDLNDWEGSLGGHPKAQTPNMDRLFQQGLLFTNAHCSQAVCTASRNSVLSGLHPTSTGWYQSTTAMKKSYDQVMGNHRMLPEHFKEQGYNTLASGKVFHSGVSDYKDRTDLMWNLTGPKYKVPKELKKRGDGYKGTMFYPFPKNGPQISRHYGKEYEDGNSLATGPLKREDMPNGKMYDEITADWAVEQIGKLPHDAEQPFFMAVGFVRPHAPFTAHQKYFKRYNFEEITTPDVPTNEMSDIPVMGKSIAHGRLKNGDHHAVVNLSDTYWREMVHGYLASVSFVDDQIGRVITALEASPHKDNTIIILWSDHGQHLGEKKKWRKQSLWEEATHVPLFFKIPGMKNAGQTNSEAVSLLDIYPTLLEAASLPALPKLQGQSLLPLLKNPKLTREKPVLISWYYGNHAIRDDHWRYIQYRDGTTELYNHQTDPQEHHNLAQKAEHSQTITRLKAHIPKEPALPAGKTTWEPDKLDRRIETWKTTGIPEWLK